jgi:hypothetical protein
MAYDKSKDKKLWEKEVAISIATSIIVGIYSYDGGEKKLGLSRMYATGDGNPKFQSIGRMTRTEIELLLPVIKEALDTNNI